MNRHNTKAPGASLPIRERIMGAGFGAFLEHGYANASTLEIATRARVSKRELYAEFKNKEALFEAGIADRTARMRFPLELPDVNTREALEKTLESLGVAMLTELTGDAVLSVYRLAIAESVRSPQVAKLLDRAGRNTTRRALSAFLKSCAARGLVVDGDPSEMCDEFCALLLSDTMMRLLLGVAKKPGPQEIARRARAATESFLNLRGTDRALMGNRAAAPAGQTSLRN